MKKMLVFITVCFALIKVVAKPLGADNLLSRGRLNNSDSTVIVAEPKKEELLLNTTEEYLNFTRGMQLISGKVKKEFLDFFDVRVHEVFREPQTGDLFTVEYAVPKSCKTLDDAHSYIISGNVHRCIKFKIQKALED